MSRKPNLFIIGAMKAGTTSLHNYLSSHPQIFMSSVKEPKYFSSSTIWRGSDKKYRRLFAAATDELYAGEASTEYSKRTSKSEVAERIYSYSPRARIIYLVRDPLERAISQYKHMMRNHYEIRRFSEVITDPYDRTLTNSHYAYQLRPYIDLFESNSIYVDTFESLINSPQLFCRRLFSWLGIDDSFVPPNLGKTYNAGPDSIYVMDATQPFGRFIHKIARTITFRKSLSWLPVEQLETIIPKTPVDFRSGDFAADIEIAKAALAKTFVAWIKELEEMTGQDYSDWPSYQIGDRATVSSKLVARLRRKLGPLF